MTCNPRNLEFFTSYGADAVYDYRSNSAFDAFKRDRKAKMNQKIGCLALLVFYRRASAGENEWIQSGK